MKRPDNKGNDRTAAWDILVRFAHVYLDDFQSLTPDWLDTLLHDPNFYLLCHHRQKPMEVSKVVGLLWLSDFQNLKSCHIHFLVEPGLIRQALRFGVFPAIIDFIFSHYPIPVIRADFMESQKSAWHLLSGLGFEITGHYLADTTVNGLARDRYGAQLHRRAYERQRRVNKEQTHEFR